MQILKINSEGIEYNSSKIEKLASIDLSTDTLIIVPETFYNVKYNNFTFKMQAEQDIYPDKQGRYIYYPRIKVSLPHGMKMLIQNKILGLSIIQEKKEEIEGYSLDIKLPLTDININTSDVLGEYTYGKNFQFYLKEYSRDFIIKSLGSRLFIPKEMTIVEMFLVPSFIGRKEYFKYNEMIIIESDYIYNNFPFIQL